MASLLARISPKSSVLALMSILSVADIAFDFAAHYYGLRIDVAVDHGVIAQVQSAVGLDFAIYFSVEGQFSRKLESTLDFCARVQEVLGCFSAPYEWSVFSLWVDKFSPVLRPSQPFHYFVCTPAVPLLFQQK